MIDPNIKLNPTLDKNGNPTAQARMTSTEDQQKCQMEIARYMPIMLLPGIMGSNLLYRNGWVKPSQKSESGESAKDVENGEENQDKDWEELKKETVEKSWMPPNGLLKSIGAVFKDGLFRRVKARHREIHQELTAVDWRGPIIHIPKNPIRTNTECLKNKILKAGEQRHNLKMAQLQKSPSSDSSEIRDEQKQYEEWKERWENGKPRPKELVKEQLRFRGWGTVNADAYQDFAVFLENNLNNLAQDIRDAAKTSNGNQSGTNGLSDSDYANFVTKKIDTQPWKAVLARIDRYIINRDKEQPKLEKPLSKQKSSVEAQKMLAEWLKKVVNYQFPVYICGYNWLRDNAESGTGYHTKSLEYLESKKEDGTNFPFGPSDLNSRIQRALEECNSEQFLILTHSMGGLVTRAYAKQATSDEPGKTKNADKICGIFHNVMPATGSPAFYKRLRAGFSNEPPPRHFYEYFMPTLWVSALKEAGLAVVLGFTSRATSPILLNSPGAMQLTPWPNYTPCRFSGDNVSDPNAWLHVADDEGKNIRFSFNTKELYQNYDKWFGLWPTKPKNLNDGQQEEQIDRINFNPNGTKTIFQKDKVDEDIFEKNLERVEKFQEKHATYYLTDDNKTRISLCDSKDHLTWDTIKWVSDRNFPEDLTKQELIEAVLTKPKDSGPRGTVKMKLRGEDYFLHLTEKKRTDRGDGTVPTASGGAPITQGFFDRKDVLVTGNKNVGGYEHGSSYNFDEVRHDALFAVLESVALRGQED
ncbi:hypothetical protein [Neisseria sicca]|jgi:hypothetical protein|uniref:hypothetical protein n=2 Tax=Neisseria TaxID=482 RepID=UPI000D31B3BE|nr:hypothetical protein [Neisseria sicca]